MTAMTQYPKRLIEVDLPIRRISAHARREKSIRHGHISTLHIWWARRPLAACRAVICAALWPDPADPLCPDAFRAFARDQMQLWANHNRHLASKESMPQVELARENPAYLNNPEHVRIALLDFIADFANWDNSTKPQYLETSRALTQAAHEALGGEPGTRPLVVDPFAGGGAIPLEALRVGADAFASDLNPVAVLLNKVVLEYIPKYGQQLADEVRKRGKWIQEQAEKELAEFYPKDPDGATPIAYLWARTIRCEGPGCGAEVPLIRSLWLAKRSKNAVALRLVPNPTEKRVDFEIIHDAKIKDVGEGTVRKGSATCPVCGFTTRNDQVRMQLATRNGGTVDAKMIAVVINYSDELGREYRLPNREDIGSAKRAADELERRKERDRRSIALIPDERIPPERPSPNARGLSAVTKMGIVTFGDLYTPRQALTLVTLVRYVQRMIDDPPPDIDSGLTNAVQEVLALSVSRFSDICSAQCRWQATKTQVRNTFTRQALQVMWDFAEPYVFARAAGDYSVTLSTMIDVLERSVLVNPGTVSISSATSIPLPDSSAQAFVTDPPYFDAIPYADLSDYFFVWLKRCLVNHHDSFAGIHLTPKDDEAIWNPTRIYSRTGRPKDKKFYETQMTLALEDGQRIMAPNGIGVVVFAHKSTDGWESVLSALLTSGWTVVASWPLDTESANRVNAVGTASLASSIHLVCRPRASSGHQQIGDWREVLAELPQRIHDWMPRLVAEGVVGADAIFACLGPAVEIFSRYERVEKASGEVVTLREYLPHVWAAVSREALSTIFAAADATGFEEDARLTALWLWTLFGGVASQPPDADVAGDDAYASEDDADEATPSSKPAAGGSYVLEFDAARKIAQGLGAHLERLTAVIEVKGEKARLLPVAERARTLFGKEHTPPIVTKRKQLGVVQGALPGFPSKPRQGAFEELFGDANPGDDGASASDDWADTSIPDVGGTVLDRLHQSMLLFASGRGEALRRFLVENGIGHDERFWRLAQALSALYPMGSDEKRWVDGVLARKKGWGM